MPDLASTSLVSDPRTSDSISAAPRPGVNERLSLPFGFRAPLAVSVASLAGFALGAAHGGQYAGLRFRAENAHRLPTSQTDWYFYHKSKNYHVMLGGLKEGAWMAARLGIWVAAFVYIEEAIDRLRGATARRLLDFRDYRHRHDSVLEMDGLGLTRSHDSQTIVQRDFLSTTVAALGVAGAFSAWNRFPPPAFARTATMGLKVGLAYGLAQDVLSVLRGNKLGYIEVVRRRVFNQIS